MNIKEIIKQKWSIVVSKIITVYNNPYVLLVLSILPLWNLYSMIWNSYYTTYEKYLYCILITILMSFYHSIKIKEYKNENNS